MNRREARAVLHAARVFKRENADELWEALLSLGDASAFVAEAARLKWRFHPRGMDNAQLYERYGDGILPWLRMFVRDGVLVNVPWCIVPAAVSDVGLVRRLAIDANTPEHVVLHLEVEMFGAGEVAQSLRHPPPTIPLSRRRGR